MAIRVDQLASDILRRYDRNRDGFIDGRYETTRTTVHTAHHGSMRRHPDFPEGYDYWTRTTTVYSQGKLLAAADRNRDGLVTKRELADQIRLFDRNHNGALESRGLAFWEPKNEAEQFGDTFGERVIHRDVEYF